jgi:hypothetical protein
MKVARPARAAAFAALSLVCLVGLGFGLAIHTWHEPGRTLAEFAGYLLFVVLLVECGDACRRGGIREGFAGKP